MCGCGRCAAATLAPCPGREDEFGAPCADVLGGLKCSAQPPPAKPPTLSAAALLRPRRHRLDSAGHARCHGRRAAAAHRPAERAAPARACCARCCLWRCVCARPCPAPHPACCRCARRCARRQRPPPCRPHGPRRRAPARARPAGPGAQRAPQQLWVALLWALRSVAAQRQPR